MSALAVVDPMVGVANGWAVVDGPAIWEPACCIDAPKGLIGEQNRARNNSLPGEQDLVTSG